MHTAPEVEVPVRHETTPHEKQYTIIVNAEEKQVTPKELTFDQVVSLTFPNASKDDNRLYTSAPAVAAPGSLRRLHPGTGSWFSTARRSPCTPRSAAGISRVGRTTGSLAIGSCGLRVGRKRACSAPGITNAR